MDDTIFNTTAPESAFAVLRRFAKRRPAAAEHCELCSAEVRHGHPHLLHVEKRQILCSCEPCAVLFSGQASGHYRRIPRGSTHLNDFVIPDELWDSLMIPINLAFFYRESENGRVVAMYPSPAGAVESMLNLDTWNEMKVRNPALEGLLPEVEALLVNRMGTARDYFLVPIDECYGLVGIIRLHWKGLSGGSEVWQHLQGFFDELRRRSHAGEARRA